ncbi:FAD/NAD(P)-binding domain-containing protein [Coniochaeta ligniaria NRRL 30616]|uniref:FAD/NAD(P)-binding domain-containing protein n=1 Tax=Coniochaeta ligniaria NRRL 30616 TaxID=1408157 RepID=A0A1J7J905_9PEZI|nr:FAD/NAD(P)-binding domain-containing protein [Coniochaeta ligniaria NRRL 30616]
MGSVPSSNDISSQRVEPGSVNLPVPAWPGTATDQSIDAVSLATETIAFFASSIKEKQFDAVAALFHEDGYWRDHLALAWDFRTFKGQQAIASRLRESCTLLDVAVDQTNDWKTPKLFPLDGFGKVLGVQLYTTITTEVGTGRGIVWLAERNGEWKIWTFYTSLTALNGHEEPLGPRRGKGVNHGANPERKNWADRRKDEVDFRDSDPDVLIIGAGQAGLTAHARLKMLNVPTLIIDRNDEVGDNWRKRYKQLVLHDPVWFDHLPYLPFPDHWPVFTPKDKLAEWFDCYAKALELNIWTKSQPESATWDAKKKHWTVTVSRTTPSGTETRVLHPKHIIQATGHAGKKYMPPIPGTETFTGPVLCHSSEFPGAKPNNKGKRAVVIGACNSSHDICQDYFEQGYDVTMVQRSTTCVVSSEAATEILLGTLYEEGGPATEDADVWMWGHPAETLKALHKDLCTKQQEKDAELLAGLERVGFRLDKGPRDCGLFFKYLQRGGGYYFDVGASRLIVEGKIGVKHAEVKEVLPTGVRFGDGSVVEADEIVFATGYENMKTQARIVFGDEIGDRVDDVWGFDEHGEIRSLWRKSGHPGFWFHGGNLAMCRYFSRLLALQIKAQLLGLPGAE